MPKKDLTKEEAAEILDLLHRQRKIEAIKRYRELTGADLRNAKEAVESLENSPAGAGGGGSSSESPKASDILDVLRRKGKIEAIRRYRELTGTGLREAKEAVEAIQDGSESTGSNSEMRGHPHASKSGCGFALFLALGAAAWLFRIL